MHNLSTSDTRINNKGMPQCWFVSLLQAALEAAEAHLNHVWEEVAGAESQRSTLQQQVAALQAEHDDVSAGLEGLRTQVGFWARRLL